MDDKLSDVEVAEALAKMPETLAIARRILASMLVNEFSEETLLARALLACHMARKAP